MFTRKPQPRARQRPTDRAAVPGSTVFSYYNGEQPAADGAPTRKTKQPLTKNQKLAIVYGVSIFSLILIFFYTTLTTSPAVSFVGSSSAVYRSTNAYQERANELLSQQIGSRSKFTINTGPIEDKLLQDFPELAGVRISLPVIGRRPNLLLDLREPAMILTTNTKALVLDNSGRSVSELSQLSQSARNGLPTVEDASTLPVKVGDQAVTSETVIFIRLALAQLKAKNIEVERLTMPAVANELDIRIKGQGYYVKCDISGDAREQIGSYLAVKESGATPAEYMDVRVEEKVFYK